MIAFISEDIYLHFEFIVIVFQFFKFQCDFVIFARWWPILIHLQCFLRHQKLKFIKICGHVLEDNINLRAFLKLKFCHFFFELEKLEFQLVDLHTLAHDYFMWSEILLAELSYDNFILFVKIVAFVTFVTFVALRIILSHIQLLLALHLSVLLSVHLGFHYWAFLWDNDVILYFLRARCTYLIVFLKFFRNLSYEVHRALWVYLGHRIGSWSIGRVRFFSKELSL